MVHFRHTGQYKSGSPPIDGEVIALGVAQHGVVSRRQLLGLGLPPTSIAHRVRRGWLHPVHRGVYAVGRPMLSEKARFLAAVLACGDGAVLSHYAAGTVHKIVPANARLPVDITVSHGKKARPGLTLHRSRSLGPESTTIIDGIPVTAVARTLVDLCRELPSRGVEKAFDEALYLKLIKPGELEQALRAASGRWVEPLATAREREHTTRTRSQLEELFLLICAEAGVAPPEVNQIVRAGGRDHRVDFLWRELKLAVETDGRASHQRASAFERDRRRDVDLTLVGYRPIRFTWLDLEARQPYVMSTLRKLTSDPASAGVGEADLRPRR